MFAKKNHRLIAGILLLVLVMIGVSVYRYESKRTPEYAMQALMTGIAARDEKAIARYADIDAIAASAYDESTAILARDIEKLHAMYPQDWFFCHDTTFMEHYIAERRTQDLELMQCAWSIFLQPDAIVPNADDMDDAAFVAKEARSIVPHYKADLLTVTPEKDGARASALVEITGDASAYGQLVPKMQLKLTLLRQPDGRYRVVRIANVAENFAPIVKGIEDYCTMKGIQ